MRIATVIAVMLSVLVLFGCDEKKTDAKPEPSAKAASADDKKAGDAEKDDKKGEEKDEEKDEKDEKKEEDGGW